MQSTLEIIFHVQVSHELCFVFLEWRGKARTPFIKSTTRVRQSCTKKSYVIRGEESRVPIKADTPGSSMIH